MATILRVDRLNQYYGESHTLWDVSIEVGAGTCVALMGRNGVGKTTLLKCLMGLLPVAAGSVHFRDRPINRLSPDRRALLGIGYVPQGRDIFAGLSVEENLRIAMRTGTTEIPRRIFELFPALSALGPRRGGDLSGGQQQQLAIARALLLDPKLLILDEPTEGIQPNLVDDVARVLRHLRETGLTILLVEQKLGFARKIADSVCVLDRGRVVASGPIAALDTGEVTRHLSV